MANIQTLIEPWTTVLHLGPFQPTPTNTPPLPASAIRPISLSIAMHDLRLAIWNP
ncbi:hypothetical protein PM082_001879 [Marasmius tenuissimus]|nr:hypothetical protein PM082_001879 [Marasmius tenuissimus]